MKDHVVREMTTCYEINKFKQQSWEEKRKTTIFLMPSLPIPELYNSDYSGKSCVTHLLSMQLNHYKRQQEEYFLGMFLFQFICSQTRVVPF